MRLVTRVVAALVAAVLAGCGDQHRPTPAQTSAVTDVVANFIDSYDHGQTGSVCRLLTAGNRAGLMTALAAAFPGLSGKSCGAMISAAYGDPSDQPPAVGEAADFEFRSVTIDGSRATIVFPDGRRWHLVQAGARWLIADFPFLPPSVAGASSPA